MFKGKKYKDLTKQPEQKSEDSADEVIEETEQPINQTNKDKLLNYVECLKDFIEGLDIE